MIEDIDAVPDAPEVQPLAERFVDAWVACGDGEPRYTYSATDPDSRIDYIFVSPDVSVKQIGVLADATTRLASDHLPVLAMIAVPGSKVGVGQGTE